MRGASGDECGNLVLGQEYNRPAEAGVLKKPRGSDFNIITIVLTSCCPQQNAVSCNDVYTETIQSVSRYILLH
jgi:hypothetical protein